MKTYNDTCIENLRFAIVKMAVDDYKKMLKTEQKLENQKAKFIREHKKLANNIKAGACSRAQFIIKHEGLKAERIRLGENRKRNKDEIKNMEVWFYSDWGQLLVNVDTDYIISQVRKIVKEKSNDKT